jgi:low temperature requirement protein LtrA
MTPRIRASLASPGDQGATFVELFFDLVFVFAVTQITHYAASHLDAAGVSRSILVFWLVWWAWTQFTWALNAADTDHHHVRLWTLVSTGVAFVMAASVEQAFGEGALWFALPYVLVRLLGLGLYRRVAHTQAQAAAIHAFALWSLSGFAAVLIGALLDPSVRSWAWLAAIALDLLAARIGAQRGGWDLNPKHFAERHGLFVIIALGESLIVAGAAVASEARTPELVRVGALAVAATCLLWWSYFGWVKDVLEHRLATAIDEDRSTMARDVYSLAHFPLVCGIIAYAVGVEGVLSDPDGPVALGVALALAAGVLLFVGSTAWALRRSAGKLLVPRLVCLTVIAAALWQSASRSGVTVLSALCLGLVIIVAVEHLKGAQAQCASTTT